MFKAVYKEYKVAPDITRRRLFIETVEAVLKNSGRIIVADNDSGVVKILNVDDTQAATTDAENAASVLQGGDAQ